MDFKIRIFLLLVMCGLSHLSGSAQSNLVFLRPYSLTADVINTAATAQGSYNVSINQNALTIPDSAVFKVTHVSVYGVVNLPGEGYVALNGTPYKHMTVLVDSMMIQSGTVEYDQSPNTTNVNMWLNEGNHSCTVSIPQNSSTGNYRISLNGVLYKKVPIDLE
jgi:hypothetical protein